MTAYLNALDYTKIRKQGADLARAADKVAPRVEIIRHPDVRRMLMLQKSLAEGDRERPGPGADSGRPRQRRGQADGPAQRPAATADQMAALGKAHDDVGAILMGMMGKLGQSVYHVGFQGNRILFALAELVIGWRLVVNAEVARGKLTGAGDDERAF